MNTVASSPFAPVSACWICGGPVEPVAHRAIFEFEAYRDQDPELAELTGATVDLMRCRTCGFGQPAGMPTLPRYFDRMYDQRWSDEWMMSEFVTGTKDYIFRRTLRDLGRRLGPGRRSLLDVGTHVGRLPAIARSAGWKAEGVELNPRTAAFAERHAGVPIHRIPLDEMAGAGLRFDAVTLVDVLEHIPGPIGLLRDASAVLAPGGWIAVKVPHGPAQLRKELIRGRLFRGYRPTVADNLVHVSHFTPESLTRALRAAGFADVEVGVGAPVLAGSDVPAAKRVPRNARLLAVYLLARAIPGGAKSPIGLNLQAYARKA